MPVRTYQNRLIDGLPYKLKWKQLSTAWTRFDRSTAYCCVNKGVPFNEEYMKQCWAEYTKLLDTLYT